MTPNQSRGIALLDLAATRRLTPAELSELRSLCTSAATAANRKAHTMNKRDKISYAITYACGGWDGHQMCAGVVTRDAHHYRECECVCHLGQPAAEYFVVTRH